MIAMNIKTGEMRGIYETVKGLALNADGSPRRLPAKMSYWVARMIAKLQTEYDTSEQMRLALAEELGTRSKDGSVFNFEADAAKQFNERFAAILDTDLSIELPQIFISSMENVEIEPGLLLALDKLITE